MSAISAFQVGFLIGESLQAGSYSISAIFRVTSPLDPQALSWAWERVMLRHSILRTTYEQGPEGHRARVHASMPVPFRVTDARGWDEPRFRAYVRSAASKCFQLEKEPPFQCEVLERAHDDATIILLGHHIALDFPSMSQMLFEVGVAYEARTSGRVPELGPTPLGYSDFCESEAASPTGRWTLRAIQYWKEKLAGSSFELALPTDFARTAFNEHRRAHATGTIPGDVAGRLVETARAEGTSLFRALVAAFTGFLYRLSGQGDILVGTPVGCRPPGFEQVVGNFANMVALRLRHDETTSFRELLSRADVAVKEAIEHRHAAFSLVKAAVAPSHDLSRNPIYQARVILLRPGPAPFLGPATIANDLPWRARWGMLDVEPAIEKVMSAHGEPLDLALLAAESKDGLLFTLEYNAALFHDATVARFAKAFTTFVASCATSPDAPIARLPVLEPAELRALARGRTDAGTPAPLAELEIPSHRHVHELFEDQAKKTPDAVAVEDAWGSLTYRELDLRADAIAAALARRGVDHQAMVGVLSQKGGGLLAAMLGVWKAGCVYLPLGPQLPAERLRGIVEDSGAVIVLADDALVPIAQRAAGERPVAILPFSVASAEQPEVRATRPRMPSELAYVIYTSGSTGAPKGALLEHRGLAVHLEATVRTMGIAAGSRVAQIAAQTFDVSVWQFLAAITVGGTTVVAPDDVVMDGQALIDFIDARRISIIQLVPSQLRAMLDADRPVSAGLKCLSTGGEALAPELARRWFARHAGHAGHVSCPLVNAYGPTECSQDVTYHTLREAPPAGAAQIPIGTPLPHTVIYLLDARGEPVVPGAIGEIFVSGDLVGRGYLGRPEQTARSFLVDPFASRKGTRMYRTGDLGRQLPDGSIVFLGRIDHQVKVRGHRIELGEIETQIEALAGVRDVAVLVRDEPPRGPHLVAYVVPQPGANLDAIALRRALKKQLPDPMIPSVFVLLDALPLTDNGKLDREALPAAPAVMAQASARTPPATEIERDALALFEEALGLSGLGVEDDFFELGGHSLQAVALVGKLQSRLGLRIGIQGLLRHPTVRDTIRFASSDGATPTGLLVPLRPGDRGTPLFLVHAVDGTTNPYERLALVFAPGRPIHGLRAPGIDGDGAIADRLESLAAKHVETMRAVQPAGPYLVGGWSFGGLVALEVARQLTLRGETAAVALIDTASPGYLRIPTESEIARLAEATGMPAASAVCQAHAAMLERYQPARFEGRVWLARGERRVAVSGDDGAAFRPFLPHLEIVSLDADHEGVLRPPVSSELATALEQFARTCET